MARHNVRNSVALGAIMALSAGVFGCTASAQVGSPPSPPPAPAPPPAPEPPKTEAPKPEPPKAETPPPPKSQVTASGGKLTLPGNIVYETGKAIIKAESTPTLEQLKTYLDENKQVSKLRIEGHTDNVGQPAANMKLSADRAGSVVKWLTDHSIDKGRLLAVGCGDKKPIADNKTEDGKAQNRRTEFHWAEIEGKAFMGRPMVPADCTESK